MEITGRKIKLAKGDTGTIIISLRQGCSGIPDLTGQKAVFIIKDAPQTPDSEAIFACERQGSEMTDGLFPIFFDTETTAVPGKYRWAIRLTDNIPETGHETLSAITLAEGLFEVYQGTFR